MERSYWLFSEAFYRSGEVLDAHLTGYDRFVSPFRVPGDEMPSTDQRLGGLEVLKLAYHMGKVFMWSGSGMHIIMGGGQLLNSQVARELLGWSPLGLEGGFWQ